MPAKEKSLKTAPVPEHIVVDDDGTEYILHGYGWAKDYPLDIDPRIDLTQPIWEQVQRLERLDKRAEQKQKSTAAA
jgi:DNA-directed RNA polymerase subunit H (RpoH/RPB5)